MSETPTAVTTGSASGGLTEETLGELRQIAARYPEPRSGLLPMLHLVQSVEGRVTPEGIEAWAWTQAYSKQAITEMAQQYCQRDGRNAQFKDSEVAEKHLFKGSRVVYRFNCVR